MFAHSRYAVRMLVAALASHWRPLCGAALVAGFCAGIILVSIGYPTAGLITIVVCGSGCFLGMFDFDGMRRGVVWMTCMVGAVLMTVTGFTNHVWIPAYLCAAFCVALGGWVFIGLLRWCREYRRSHPAETNNDDVLIIR